MESKLGYLNGDVAWLQNVDKTVNRKFEVPLTLMISRIQVRKNVNGIKDRLLCSIKSYNIKFRSLEPEYKQPIRALRSRRSKSLPAKAPVQTRNNRFASSSEWKLPPNLYNIDSCHLPKMTVTPVKNHFSAKPESNTCKTDFYECSTKLKVEKKLNNTSLTPRFSNKDFNKSPAPTKYYPENYTLKNNATKPYQEVKEKNSYKSFYNQTTVPIRETLFNAVQSITPAPSYYSARPCWKQIKFKEHNDCKFMSCKRNSINNGENTELRYNTIIKKRNIFGIKSVAFLSTTPRFADDKNKTNRNFKSQTCH